MHPIFEAQLREVHQYYETQDNSLALRRLLDCALETKDMDIFRSALDFCDWLETEPEPSLIQPKAAELLTRISHAGVKVVSDPQALILKVEDVSKAYKKSNFQLRDINFELRQNQVTGLVGENGNGKTTLLRLICAELEPDKGTITYPFAGNEKDRYALKTKLAYIEQRIPRWFGSLRDNLQFTLSCYGTPAEENYLWTEMMIARLGLRPFRNHTWSRLSSGYRTRFEIARTLLRKPGILLLDEPLANLDINSQQTLLQDLRFMGASLSAPFAMILSSQHIYEVEKVSDNIIFIKNGSPIYESREKSEIVAASLIIEIEVGCSRNELQEAISTLSPEKISNNGGVFLLHFNEGVKASSVLDSISSKGIEIYYFRNISNSSRRFFIN